MKINGGKVLRPKWFLTWCEILTMIDKQKRIRLKGEWNLNRHFYFTHSDIFCFISSHYWPLSLLFSHILILLQLFLHLHIHQDLQQNRSKLLLHPPINKIGDTIMQCAAHKEAAWLSCLTLDLQFVGSKFKSCPDRQLDLFTVVPSSNPWPCFLNSQLVCLRPVGILNPVKFNLNYLFQAFARPH